MDTYLIGSTVFHDWKIVRLIGEGATGSVYEIEKEEFGVRAKSALKVIRIPKSESEVRSVMYDGMDEASVTHYFKGFVDEIVQEISIMTSLKNHPNIVGYEDHSVVPHEDGFGWDILIRMQLLTPLNEWLRKNGINEQETIELGRQISGALSFCEKKKLIHRDIKPENLFVDELGNFKLGDFGIARTMEKTTGGLSKKGTESYMAPEVYLGKRYDSTVDLYSLGLVLYRLVNKNRLPFFPPAPQMITYSDRERALSDRIMGKELPPPSDASPAFANVILKASAFDRSMRYQSADELIQALDQIKGTERVEPNLFVSPNNASQKNVEQKAGENRTEPIDEKKQALGMDSVKNDSARGMSNFEEERTMGIYGFEEEHTVGIGGFKENDAVDMEDSKEEDTLRRDNLGDKSSKETENLKSIDNNPETTSASPAQHSTSSTISFSWPDEAAESEKKTTPKSVSNVKPTSSSWIPILYILTIGLTILLIRNITVGKDYAYGEKVSAIIIMAMPFVILLWIGLLRFLKQKSGPFLYCLVAIIGPIAEIGFFIKYTADVRNRFVGVPDRFMLFSPLVGIAAVIAACIYYKKQ